MNTSYMNALRVFESRMLALQTQISELNTQYRNRLNMQNFKVQVWIGHPNVSVIFSILESKVNFERVQEEQRSQLDISNQRPGSILERLNDNINGKIQNNSEAQIQKAEEIQQIFHSDESLQPGHDKQNSNLKPKTCRGTYRCYSRATKMLAVQKVLAGSSIASVSKHMNIPQKNVLRWKNQGIERKYGAGRKRCYPVMEEKLMDYLMTNFGRESKIEMKFIQAKARQLCENPEFKASKGWLANFISRSNLFNYFVLR